MEYGLNAQLEVSVKFMSQLTSMGETSSGGLLTITRTRSTVNFMVRGMNVCIFKKRAEAVCRISLPEEYRLTIPLDRIRDYLSSAAARDATYMNLGDIKFLPKLGLRHEMRKEKKKGAKDGEMVSAVRKGEGEGVEANGGSEEEIHRESGGVHSGASEEGGRSEAEKTTDD